MNDDVPVRPRKEPLDWLLDDLVRRLAGVEQGIVLAGDGLLLGRSAALDRDSAEHLAAMALAIQSLSRGVGRQFGKGLALLTSVNADLCLVAYEMNVIVQQVGASLSARPRVPRTEKSAPRSS